MQSNYSRIYYYLFACLVFFIPLSKAIPNIILALLSVLFLFKLKREDIVIFKNRYVQLLIILIILITTNSLWGITLVEDAHILGRFSLVPLILILGSKVMNTKKVKYFFVAGVNILVFMSLFSLLLFYISTKDFVFGNSKSVEDILTLGRPYIGFLCVLNVLVSLQLSNHKLRILYKIIFLVSSALSITLIILISARLSLLSLLLILFIRIFYLKKINRKRRKIVTISFFVALLATGLAVFTNKNMSERFFIEETYEKSINKMMVYEPRIVIWNCVSNITNSKDFNILLGNQGFDKTTNELVNCYENTIENVSKRNYFLREKFNTHNQFFGLLISHGLLATLILLLIFANGIYFNLYKFYDFSIVLIFLLFFLVENVLFRQLGCYIFGVFICLFFMGNSDPKNSGEKQLENNYN